MDNYFVIVSHTRFNEKGQSTHGTGSELAPLLEKKKKKYIYIQHSLFAGYATQIVQHSSRKNNIIKKGFTSLPFPLRILQEFYLTISSVLQLQSGKIVFVGIDPLNAFVGVLLKKIGKVQKVIFYTADYATNRYENRVMNAIYHWFDHFAVKHADQIWNVSSRITSVRREQGVSDEKNFFVPNAPILSIKRSTAKFEKHTLVIVTHITKAIDFESIFVTIKKLQKKYKDIKLTIIGDGLYRKELEKKVSSLSLTNQVLFTGPKPHDEVMKILSQSGVGLAIYTNDFPWTTYGDSMKAREYLACGLPVIITDVPSTADDIEKEKAGIVIKRVNEIESAIDTLFNDEKFYQKMRKNAFSLAKKCDFVKTVTGTGLLS